MYHSAPGREQLEQLGALNKLFLIHLRASVRAEADLLDLPRAVSSTLRQASDAQLDAIAACPRALFRLHLPATPALPASAVGAARSALDDARIALSVTILLCAWNVSRQSDYQARLFFALESETIRFLRTTPLLDLPHLARVPRLLRCAFSESSTLWRAFLRQTGSTLPAELALIALQPAIRPACVPMCSTLEGLPH